MTASNKNKLKKKKQEQEPVTNEIDIMENNIARIDTDAVVLREEFEKKLKRDQNPWGLSPKAIEAKRAAMTMLSIKDGMHARVPLICKGEACPYSATCQLVPADMAPVGEYCPVELAQIDIRSQGYSQDVDYDESSFTDRNLMSELVTLDIMLERCKALMAKEGTPVIDMAIGIDQEGNEIRQPNVSKAWDAYEKISKKRDSVYQLLMLTRKDKKSKNSDSENDNASRILQDIVSGGIYDVDADDDN